jgi:zinc transporter
MTPEPPHPKTGLWLALLLDGQGGARPLDWEGIHAWEPSKGDLWLHLDPTDPQVAAWLRQQTDLPQGELELLLHQGRRPFFKPFSSAGYLLALRGLAPELDEGTGELTPLHAWMTPHLTVSMAGRYLPNLTKVEALFEEGDGPRDLPALLLAMTSVLVEALHDAALDLEDPMAGVEFSSLGDQQPSAELRGLGRKVTRLRQHVAPLRIVLERMLATPGSWLVRAHLEAWRHLTDTLHDTDEMLQLLLDRASAVREDLWGRLMRKTNYVLYVLTLISAVLLPLTLLTSLLGMNVGIRGASYRWMDSTLAFVIVCAGLVVLAWAQYRFIRRRHLL